MWCLTTTFPNNVMIRKCCRSWKWSKSSKSTVPSPHKPFHDEPQWKHTARTEAEPQQKVTEPQPQRLLVVRKTKEESTSKIIHQMVYQQLKFQFMGKPLVGRLQVQHSIVGSNANPYLPDANITQWRTSGISRVVFVNKEVSCKSADVNGHLMIRPSRTQLVDG